MLELPPDLYREYFSALEMEYDAVGGDPRVHAWTDWCRLVATVLGDGDGTRRIVSLVRSPRGEVVLHDAAGPDLEWSAEPGH